MLNVVRDLILAKPIEQENKTPAGLLLPSKNEQDYTTATVVDVGPGVYEYGILRSVSVNPGMQILYGKFAGTKILNKGEVFIILKDSEILAYEAPEAAPNSIGRASFYDGVSGIGDGDSGFSGIGPGPVGSPQDTLQISN